MKYILHEIKLKSKCIVIIVSSNDYARINFFQFHFDDDKKWSLQRFSACLIILQTSGLQFSSLRIHQRQTIHLFEIPILGNLVQCTDNMQLFSHILSVMLKNTSYHTYLKNLRSAVSILLSQLVKHHHLHLAIWLRLSSQLPSTPI